MMRSLVRSTYTLMLSSLLSCLAQRRSFSQRHICLPNCSFLLLSSESCFHAPLGHL